MHSVCFQLKRAHWVGVRVAWSLLREHFRKRPLEMTPARLDLMRVVVAHTDGVGQHVLRCLMGVSGATMSRMLSSLEQLGFIRRWRLKSDRRFKMVIFTDRGKSVAREAVDATLYAIPGVAHFDGALDPYSKGAVKERTATLQEILGGWRNVLLDYAAVPDPWFVCHHRLGLPNPFPPPIVDDPAD